MIQTNFGPEFGGHGQAFGHGRNQKNARTLGRAKIEYRGVHRIKHFVCERDFYVHKTYFEPFNLSKISKSCEQDIMSEYVLDL